MRIVIDMQGAQRPQDDSGVQAASLAFAVALARTNVDHEIHLMLNAALNERIPAIRSAFTGLLPTSRIHSFDVLAPTSAQNAMESARHRANIIVREYAIACLEPEMILLTSLLEGHHNAGVTSVGAFSTRALQCVLIHAAAAGDTLEQLFVDTKNADLARTDMLLGLSAGALAGFDESKVLLLSAQAPASTTDWDAAARRLLGAVATHTPPVDAPAPARRRRLAFVSPLPPERTGIADYAVQLLPALLDHFDIELVIRQDDMVLPASLSGLRVRDAAWFTDNAHLYDQILYQFGNSPFHSHMFPLLEQHPGVVVLHDFYLSNVLAYEQMTGDTPNAWANALLHSHGYAALRASQVEGNHDAAMQAYPCNLAVLEAATGVIVHSEHAAQLARDWFGNAATNHWTVVPLPRSAPVAPSRAGARAALGISADTFLVCSFGYVTPNKLSHVLVQAWLASTLAGNSQCELVLVGANPGGDYGSAIDDAIAQGGLQGKIRIAGWTDESTYHQYLQAADMGVQLRTNSRGETSAAVLDCMNYGLPTIINANGSMAALPEQTVWRLDDGFDLPALTHALESLHASPAERMAIGTRAAALLHTEHRPSHCAALYQEALDRAMARGGSDEQAAMAALVEIPEIVDDDVQLRQLCKALASAPRALLPRQLLVDVTAIAQHDLRTGIERVVRTQLLELLKLQLPGMRVEPVYLSTAGNRWHYRYARNYAGRLMDITWAPQQDPEVDVQAGDIYYSADYSAGAVAEAARAGVYANWRARGVAINFLVHDLLPVLRPEFFPSNAGQSHARWLDVIGTEADMLIAISAAVRQELADWYDRHPPVREQPLAYSVLHHGADIPLPAAAQAGTSDSPLLAQLHAHPTFLMVGTIEPRKGHLQTIAAFDNLWRRGIDAQLVIVGSEGWKDLPLEERRTIPKIVSTLASHHELGKRLFWLQGVDDDFLQKIYAASICLLSPSEGEGFGLPLIEAARARLAVIARDLPVFREVAQEGAVYFSGLAPAGLADAIETWLVQHGQGAAPSSAAMRWSTWNDNVRSLLTLLDPAISTQGAMA